MRAVVAWALGGTLVRIAYTVGIAGDLDPGFTDAAFYSAAGNLLADGEGYVDVFRSLEAGTLVHTAHHPPGWPALLALASLLGVDSVPGHRMVGALLGGVVVLAVGLLARRIAGDLAGAVAAAAAALHPTLVAADASLMTETLGGLLVLGVVALGLQAARHPTLAWTAGLGAGIGLSALVRGESLLHLVLVGVPVAIAAAKLADRARALAAVRTLGVVLLATAAVVLPWTLRNADVLGEPVLISTNDSTVLAGANCDATDAGPGIGSWDLDCIDGGTGDEAADARTWRAQALDHVREDPRRLPAVVTARVLRTWGAWDPLAATAEGRHDATQRVGNVVWLALLLPAGSAGAVVLGRRGRRLELVLLLAPVAAGTIVSVLGFGMLRFRHPIELSALVLAGVAFAALVRRRRPVASGTPAVVGS